MQTITYLYNLREQGFTLWIENHKLKYSQYLPCDTADEILTILKEQRDEIFEILDYNHCYTEEAFQNLMFFKLPKGNQEVSFGQERLYFIDRYTEGTSAYHIYECYKIKEKEFDLPAFEFALKQIITRHDILRTLIKQDAQGNLYQEVTNKIAEAASVRTKRIGELTELEYLLKEEIERPFNLSSDFPLRTLLYERENGERYLSFVIHHIAFDGWSVDLFLKELDVFYRQIPEEIEQLPCLKVQYKDFSAWQRAQQNSTLLQDQCAYWNKQLEGYENLHLILDKPRPNHMTYRGRDLAFQIGHRESVRLRTLAKRWNVSLFTLCLSACYLMLKAYSRQADLIVGTPVSNRQDPEVEYLLGNFVNTLALRCIIDSSLTLKDFIQSVGQLVIDSQAHQDVPFEKLLNELGVQNDPSRHPIFQVMCAVQSFGEVQTNHFLEHYHPQEEFCNTAKFDLSLLVDDSQEALQGVMNYATDLYEPATIREYLSCYLRILDQFAQIEAVGSIDEHMRVSDITYCDARKILADEMLLKQEECFYPKEKTIPELFEEQVLKNPTALALSFGKQRWSYGALNNKANQLARYLKALSGVQPDQCVVLCLNRSEWVVIALLAILKSGAAYVPVDPNTPNERISHILRDTNATLVVTDQAGKLSLFMGENDRHVIDITHAKEEITSYPSDNLSPRETDLNCRNLAYVLYTSGTTGHPKGVMIEHRSFISTVYAFKERHFLTMSSINTLSLTNVVFDIFGLEYGLTLLTGGMLTLASQPFLEAQDCTDFHFIQMTPSLCEANLDQLFNVEKLTLVVGGEALRENLLERIARRSIDCLNVYGPTETTIWSTSMSYLFSKSSKGEKSISVRIGTPLKNEVAYVLDENFKLMPPYAVGELYLSGIGLARGYWNSPELTEQKFLRNPFQNGGEYSRIYRTGDLVRRHPDGNLEFVGRIDDQIKLRGHRIELGEITNALDRFPGISMGVVLLGEDDQGTPLLIAYYQTEDQKPRGDDEISCFLAEKLPSIMIPAAFVHLEAFPLTSNGKIDRRKLPKFSKHHPQRECIVPKNPFEEEIAAIWKEVLGINERQISLEDEFFKIGGNSLLAIKLINKINRQLNADLKIKDLFIYPTLGRFCQALQESDRSFAYHDFIIHAIDQDHLYDPFPLSNVQQAYYLGNSKDLDLGNTSAHVYVEYAFLDLDLQRLEMAFNKLIDRHLALRTVFINGTQRFLEKVPHYSVSESTFDHQAQFLAFRHSLSHKVYSPERFPLFDISVSRYEGKLVLHISFDTLLMDAESVRILFEEWTALYRETENAIEPIRVTYRDYLMHYGKLRESTLYQQAKIYWEQKLPEYNFEMNLPLKREPSKIEAPIFRRISKVIDRNTWEKVVQKAQRYSITPTALVLGIFGRVLCRWSGKNSLCINLTLFNRLPLHHDIDRVVGDFTTLLLYHYVDRNDQTVNAQFQAVHRSLLSDLENTLFDGIEFQRLARQKAQLEGNRILAPVVLTSVLGDSANREKVQFLDESCCGEYYSITQTPQVWLDNKAYETVEGFVAEWDYVEELFDRATIEGMHHAYCQLIEALAELDWTETENLSIPLPLDELHLIEECNATDVALPEGTLLSLTEAILYDEAYQSRVAVYSSVDEREYSYAELRKDSEALAKALACQLERFGGKGKPIAVLCEKGYHQVVAILSVMKCGCSFIPLHADWPMGRIEEIILQASVSALLVTGNHSLLKGKFSNCQTLVMEELLEEANAMEIPQVEIASPPLKPDDIAYIIFTSGSTGKPKGVVITHRGAVNTILAVNHHFHVASSDAVLAISELSFDLAIYDLFGMLFVGGKVVMPNDNNLRDPRHWIRLVRDQQVTIWNSVPQLANLYIEELYLLQESVSAVRLFLLSGDWIPTGLPNLLRGKHPQATIVSLGGATEGSIWSIWYEVARNESFVESIPYGIPMPNQQIWILNNDSEHTPVGVIGEIYIGGDGVASYYLGDDEGTARSFVHHPTLGKLYRTGDYGKWNRQGYVEFLGRKDHQVKINGYRVELGEIASHLGLLPGIKDAIVKISKDQHRSDLVGYLIAEVFPERNLLDREQFLFQQRGINREVDLDHPLNFTIDESQYRLRKSYRSFTSIAEPMVLSDIFEMYQTASEALKRGSYPNRHQQHIPQSMDIVISLLKEVTGIWLNDKPLPKYQYPSAGNTYPVRCYVEFPASSEQGQSESYYFHPLTPGLCRVSSLGLVKRLTYPTIHFIVHRPAIEPLYGELSYRLSCLEAGHMIGLMLERLREMGVPFQLKIIDQAVDDSNTVIAALEIQTEETILPQSQWTTHFMEKSPLGESYRSQEGDLFYDLSLPSILEQATENHQLLKDGTMLVALEGEQTPTQWVMAGILFQNLSLRLLENKIGCCPLGLQINEKMLYTMVLGRITEDEIAKGSSSGRKTSLTTVINQTLSSFLPDYMLPTHYMVMERFPLTINGKLDHQKLPKPILEASEIEKPRNDFEIQICAVWGEILGIDPQTIGISDDFFKLGGDSIKCIQLMSRLRQKLGIEISVKDLFIHHTIDKFSRHVASEERRSPSESETMPSQRPNETRFLANSLQQGFVYHALNHPEMSQNYIVQSVWHYNSPIVVERLKKSWELALQNFEALQLHFTWGDEILQVIDPKMELDWRTIDRSSHENENVHLHFIEKLKAQDLREGFKLHEGPLFRLYLIKFSEAQFTCIFSSHHAILDGWSQTLLLEFIHQTYFRLGRSQGEIPSIHDSYWLSQKYIQEHRKVHDDFWKKKIAQIKEHGIATFKRTIKTTQQSKRGTAQASAQEERRCFGELYRQLKESMLNRGITLNALLQFCWHRLLCLYHHSEQTVVGTTVSTRNLPVPGIEQSIGLHINTLPFFVDHSLLKGVKIVEVLRKLQLDLSEISSRSGVSLSEIQSRGEPLFDTLFVFANYPSYTPSEEEKGLNIRFEEVTVSEDYPLVFTAYEEDHSLRLIIKYDPQEFTCEVIQSMMACLMTLLEQVQDKMDQSIEALTYLDHEQSERILRTFNQTARNFPFNKGLSELFEDQVAQHPHSLALVCDDRQLTYETLNREADKFADYLRNKLLSTEERLVILLMERSEKLIVSLLAVLKAGAAYVPIDPSYPKQRVEWIVEDTKAPIIITDKFNAHQVIPLGDKFQAEVIVFDEEENIPWKSDCDPCKSIVENSSYSLNNLAYVIYTSGTTGRPKGVMIEHASVVNYVHNIAAHRLITSADRVDFSTAIGFDLSVTTTLCSLCLGAQIALYTGSLSDLSSYQQHLIKRQVTVFKHVPSYFELILESLPTTQVQKIILGGEKLKRSIVERIKNLSVQNDHSRAYFEQLAIYDEYGPTEATVGCCLNRVTFDGELTIGVPYSNVVAYVLDSQLNPLPIGAIGELYIGGRGLARGYLNDLRLTQTKFLPNPFKRFSDLENVDRIYKTGDLVRCLPEGILEYIARCDSQVKVNGYRIELDEIQQRLEAHLDLLQGAVAVKIDPKTGANRIVAYVVPGEFTPTPTELKEFLAITLPSYMIPSSFVFLTDLPLTVHGKLDEKKLPDPEIGRDCSYLAPEDDIDREVCAIWSEVLGVPLDYVGMNSDFFELGGNSILAIKLTHKINEAFGVDLTLGVLLENTVVKDFTDHLKTNHSEFLLTDKYEF